MRSEKDGIGLLAKLELKKKLFYCLNDEFIPINHPVLADISSINDVLLRFGQRSNLIYCNAKSKAISYAKELLY